METAKSKNKKELISLISSGLKYHTARMPGQIEEATNIKRKLICKPEIFLIFSTMSLN